MDILGDQAVHLLLVCLANLYRILLTDLAVVMFWVVLKKKERNSSKKQNIILFLIRICLLFRVQNT